MKTIIRSAFAGGMFLAFMGFYGCSSEMAPSPVTQNDLTEVSDMEVSEDLVIEEITDDILFDLEQFEFKKSETVCPVITVERPTDARFPKVVTKDFGDGCTTDRGVEKSGKVIVTLYGPWLKEGSVRTVEFENYTHRGISVTGKEKITCEGVNADSLFVHSITGTLTLTRDDGVVVERRLNKQRTLLAGFGDPLVPNEWLIEGSMKVAKSTGITYTVNVREPLHRIQGCRWAQSGIKVIRFTREETDAEGNVESIGHRIVIDFGTVGETDSNCDSVVSRKVDDGEWEVVDLSARGQ